MPETSGSTDAKHTVSLTSELTSVEWLNTRVFTGGLAAFMVIARFVGDGSKIEATIKDQDGKVQEKVKGRIFGDLFFHAHEVTAGHNSKLTVEVKLPDHGLDDVSGTLKVSGGRIANAKWGSETLKRGQFVDMTAETSYLENLTRVHIRIFENDEAGHEAHEPVTEFDARVEYDMIKTKWEFRYTGKLEDIPTKEEAGSYQAPRYFFEVSCGGLKTKSNLTTFVDSLDLEVVSPEGEPFKEQEFVLTLPDGEEVKDKLDAKGKFHKEEAPPGRCKLKIEYKPVVESAAAGATEDATYWMRMTFMYEDGETPFAFVDCVLVSPSGKEYKTKTDKDGKIAVKVDEAGDYEIRLEEGFEVFTWPFHFEPEEGEELDDEDDDVEDVDVLCATVLNVDGVTPLANELVEVVQLREGTRTDENGYFEIVNVPDRIYRVRVRGRELRIPSQDEPNPDYKVRLPSY